MKAQANRLPADAKHGLGGAAIDRNQPLSFRLNGRRFEAFAGDTVFSALLAAGIDTSGIYHGEPIGIDERFAPPVVAPSARDARFAMPMDRAPVLAGLDLRTIGPGEGPLPFRRFGPRLLPVLVGSARTLGHRLDDPRALDGAWLAAGPSMTIEADTIVIGGGLAGMSAALAA